MGQLAEGASQPVIWEERVSLRRLGAVKTQEEGWHEPDESRGSRPVL